MFKLIKEKAQYNNNNIITITYNNQTIFYKGFSEIGEREIRLIKDQAFKDLLRVLNTGAVPANIYSNLINIINTLIEPIIVDQSGFIKVGSNVIDYFNCYKIVNNKKFYQIRSNCFRELKSNEYITLD